MFTKYTGIQRYQFRRIEHLYVFVADALLEHHLLLVDRDLVDVRLYFSFAISRDQLNEKTVISP